MATFYNQATLSYNGNVINSNITTGELLEVLSATKTAVMDDYVANDDVTYVISIVNAGATAFTGLTITDNLGTYAFGATELVPLTYIAGSIRYYINGVLQAVPSAVGGPPLVITGINVPANGNATIIYEVHANQYAPLGVDGTIVNEAEITGGGLATAILISETISTENIAVLTISKSICPSTVTENGQLIYTFTIQNTGNTAATAVDNVILTDTFNPILNPISVTFNGANWSVPVNYSYDNTTGEFATASGQITVPAAIFTQDPVNGNWEVTPGVSTLVVTGTV
ncbi:hypothetical protein [Hydrogenoanaerobacterium sp.]|uniref:hypothetical protein n=1 Tax=Hydrogenoanaerobacterium sp. TaxID=2953763 RepID=UPI0028A1AC6F|nr:hypothetical protein [Hydrogenoanaerobacterium sp.]